MNGKKAREIRKRIYGVGMDPRKEAYLDPADNQVKIRGRKYQVLYREKDIPIIEAAAKLPADASDSAIRTMKDKLLYVSRTLKATGLRREYKNAKKRYNRGKHSSVNP